ncbi:MAG: hypothetical protein Q8L87_18785 [Anaerolineales bacterium]|nr:hypothetical protein [Anaerolineales bacterium]
MLIWVYLWLFFLERHRDEQTHPKVRLKRLAFYFLKIRRQNSDTFWRFNFGFQVIIGRNYTQRGHKSRFFKGGKAQFVPCGHDMTAGIIDQREEVVCKNHLKNGWRGARIAG